MRILPLTSIRVAPDRQRQYFDPDRLAELQESIGRLGLIQPIVVTANGQLVAGERRLKCVQNLDILDIPVRFNNAVVPAGCIPAVLPSEASDEALFEIELEENIKRQDISWQEQAQAVAKLQKLRMAQATATDSPPPTVADIAEEVEGRRDGAYQSKTRKSLIVAKHLADPAIAKAKTVDDAFKILKAREVAEQNIGRAAEVGKLSVHQQLAAVNEDCLEWGWRYVEQQKGPLFDIICTDPPYGMGAQNFGDAGGSYVAIDHEYADDRVSWEMLMNQFAQLSWAITKPDAHLYVACDIDGFHTLRTLFQQTGWRVHRTPLISVKRDANRVPWPQQGPRRSYELVLYAVRGSKPTTSIYSDVFETSGDDNLGHGAQKPVAFWEDLLRRSARPGDSVLDPFAGTGGILVAAHKQKLRCVAVEQSQQYFGICIERIRQLADKDEPLLDAYEQVTAFESQRQ